MPRCKNCKEKFDAKHFNQKFCFKPMCVNKWVELAKAQNWKATKKKLKEKVKTRTDYLKEAQRVFNAYIRKRDFQKYGTCISCGKTLKPGNIDAGHYFSAGGHSNTRFDLDNTHAQCSRPCNKDKSGDLINYQIGIVQRIGNKRVLDLYARAYAEKQWSIEELKEIIATYKQKIKEL
jgi:hypothetical protein